VIIGGKEFEEIILVGEDNEVLAVISDEEIIENDYCKVRITEMKSKNLSILHPGVEKLEIKKDGDITIAKIDNDFVDLANGYTAHFKPR